MDSVENKMQLSEDSAYTRINYLRSLIILDSFDVRILALFFTKKLTNFLDLTFNEKLYRIL